MFWNLVRYEFKNVNKWYLALYGAVLAISVLIGAFINSLSQSYNPNNAAYFIFFLVLVFWRTQRHSLDCNNLFNHPKIQG